MAPRRKADQSAPAVSSPTGVVQTDAVGPIDARAQSGDFLTTAQGLRLPDTDHSLKAGPRGPSLLEDFHLREKITHFDHERIPERVVHARGAAAHGVFESYGNAASVTKAGFLAEKGKTTDVFCRFSTVLGSRGSADTVRDTRGFAVKFYTDEGTFDLVGNNIPVFFIQDGIKFPDIIHAAKPHPDREIPQAQSAHDTFWDFVSLHTEATHHVMWNMSRSGHPAFLPHDGRLRGPHVPPRQRGRARPAWSSSTGSRWPACIRWCGKRPRSRPASIPTSTAATWPTASRPARSWNTSWGSRSCPTTAPKPSSDLDLLDPTKIVPEELVPVQLIGKLTLNRNPTNYFAETEQVAFHLGHLVPGIEVTNDPLLQARLFSYLDTQLTRLGGPNFPQLPINRPHAPVNDMLRDGMHQTAIHTGLAPYRPNSIDGGAPAVAGAERRRLRPDAEAHRRGRPCGPTRCRSRITSPRRPCSTAA